MDDLFSEFLSDTAERLAIAEGALTQPDALLVAIRHIHTIRGAAGFMQAPRILALVESAEGMLLKARTRGAMSAGELSIFQRCTERLRGIIAGAEANGAEPEGDDNALIDALATPVADNALSAPARAGWEQLSSEAASARNTLTGLAAHAGEEAAPIGAIIKTSTVIEQETRALRRVPLENISRSLPRLAQQAADLIGKQVEVRVEGGAIALEADIALEVRAVLIHLVRNAVAHGIEMPAIRRACGKAEAGAIRIAAHRDGEAICIDVSDDGAGLDLAAIRKRGIENGMIGAAQAVRLSDEETLALLFAPGFSTARHVTALAGCGIGLDAVKASVEKLGGRLELESLRGAGIAFRMRLAQTGAAAPVITLDPAHPMHERLRPLLGAAGYDIAEGAAPEPAPADEERKEQTA